MRKLYLSLLIFLCTLFIAFTAEAQKSTNTNSRTGFYVDTNFGYVFAETGLFGPITTNDGFGLNANFGYQFNRYIATEIGYIYLNNLEGNSINWGVLDLKGIIPVTDTFDFFGKIGGAVVIDRSTTGALFLAVGGEYFFTPHFDMHVQLSGEVTGFANFGLISAGLSYHF